MPAAVSQNYFLPSVIFHVCFTLYSSQTSNMHNVLLLTWIVTSPLIFAHPLQKKQVGPLSVNDTNTLQLAHFLKLLELNLYTGGFQNFTDAQYDSMPP
jgi:hypothetical protein